MRLSTTNANLAMAINCRCYRYYWCWPLTRPATMAAMRSNSGCSCNLNALVATVCHRLDASNAARPKCWPAAIEMMRSANKVLLHRRVASAEAAPCENAKDIIIKLMIVFRRCDTIIIIWLFAWDLIIRALFCASESKSRSFNSISKRGNRIIAR